MDKNLQMLRDLYEAETDPGDLRLLDSEEPGLGDEHGSMREMKALLEARPRQKPSARAVQAVLDAAAERGAGRRRDRAPLARRSAVYLRVGAVSAVVIVLLAVVTVFQIDLRNEFATTEQPLVKGGSDDLASEETDLLREEAEAPNTPEIAGEVHAVLQTQEDRRSSRVQVGTASTARHEILAAGREDRRPSLESLFEAQPAAFQSAFADAPAFSTESEDVLSWDESGDVIQVYQHIEMLGGGVDRGWEPPSVPLEMLPQTRRIQPSIQPAGQREFH